MEAIASPTAPTLHEGRVVVSGPKGAGSSKPKSVASEPGGRLSRSDGSPDKIRVEFVAPKRLAIGPHEQVPKLARIGEPLGEVTRQEHQGLDHTEKSVFSRLPEVVTRFPAIELIRFGATNGKDQLVGLCWGAEATLELETQVSTSQASLVQFAFPLGAEVLTCAKQEEVAHEQSAPHD